MKNRTTYYIVLSLIGLSVLGLLATLVEDPVGFLKGSLILLAVVMIVVFIFRKLFSNPGQNQEQRAYRKAAKESQKRHKNQSKAGKQAKTSSTMRTVRRRRKAPHLTVIEGKKSKRKNQA